MLTGVSKEGQDEGGDEADEKAARDYTEAAEQGGCHQKQHHLGCFFGFFEHLI